MTISDLLLKVGDVENVSKTNTHSCAISENGHHQIIATKKTSLQRFKSLSQSLMYVRINVEYGGSGLEPPEKFY